MCYLYLCVISLCVIFMIPPPRDFIDVYLVEMMKGSNPNFDMESLELTCLDLFKAGAETSSTTLLWIILFLTR